MVFLVVQPFTNQFWARKQKCWLVVPVLSDANYLHTPGRNCWTGVTLLCMYNINNFTITFTSLRGPFSSMYSF
jgi:hypothetical protein